MLGNNALSFKKDSRNYFLIDLISLFIMKILRQIEYFNLH